MASAYAERKNLEQRFTPSRNKSFTVPGFSYPARRLVKFRCDFAYSDGQTVNWRERLICPITKLNNRLRASVHLADGEIGVTTSDKIYITEQVTPLYKYLSGRYPQMIGSEFLGDSVPRGSTNANGIFNQDLTSLSFTDESFDVVLSFDCFEHMPDFDLGMREVARVLKPGGRMMWSVPFRSDLDSNLVRATHSDDGEILHHEPPEYHGDPVNTAGCLCYTHFGWQMLDQVKNCGYSKAYAVVYWSDVFGYLGTENFIFVAIK